MARGKPEQTGQNSVILMTVGVLLAAVAVFIVWPRSDDDQNAGANFEPFEGDAPREVVETTGGGEQNGSPGAAAENEKKGSVVVLENRVEESDQPPITASGDSDADAGAGAGKERGDGGYVDPVNEEVLGPKTWMPELPEEEREEINEELDRQRPDQFPIDLDVRREGIEVAKAVVFDCYDALRRRQPQRTGRIIVSFDVAASGGRATLENTEVPTNVKLDDPQFESCIIDGINGLTIASSDEGTMRVKYPFLFDIEGKR